MKRVWLDAGHGGIDPGASGNGLIEKLITLPVALRVGEILKSHGVEVGQTRTTDTTVDLNRRAVLANNFNADIFVSIHCNSFANAGAKGVETYSYPSSVNGRKLASSIHSSIINDKLYTTDRGLKTANFAVLRQTKMPSCLVELAFISNVDDAKLLRSKQEEFAVAIVKGILKYLGIAYKQPDVKRPAVKESLELKEINTIVHGKKISTKGFVEYGTNYIPIRFLEELGYELDWDNENKSVVINYKKK